MTNYEILYKDPSGEIVQACVSRNERTAIANIMELRRVGISAFYRAIQKEKEKDYSSKQL